MVKIELNKQNDQFFKWLDIEIIEKGKMQLYLKSAAILTVFYLFWSKNNVYFTNLKNQKLIIKIYKTFFFMVLKHFCYWLTFFEKFLFYTSFCYFFWFFFFLELSPLKQVYINSKFFTLLEQGKYLHVKSFTYFQSYLS